MKNKQKNTCNIIASLPWIIQATSVLLDIYVPKQLLDLHNFYHYNFKILLNKIILEFRQDIRYLKIEKAILTGNASFLAKHIITRYLSFNSLSYFHILREIKQCDMYNE